MDQMQQQAMSWIEVQFLRRAVDVLGECRRTLMYTYAFAYYLQRDNQAEIFEGNQKVLVSVFCLPINFSILHKYSSGLGDGNRAAERVSREGPRE